MPIADVIVGDILEAGRARHPQGTALLWGHETRTYAGLADRVELLAGALQSVGVIARDRIAVLAPNHPAVVEILLAAALLGAVVVPLNPRSTAADLTFQIDDAAVGFAVVHEAIEPLARTAGLLDRRHWFCGDGIDDLVSAGLRVREDQRPSAESILVQLYTSGTTGRPKGCMLTHRGWLSATAGFAHGAGISSADVVWAQLPLFHVAGIHFLLTTLAAGATYVLDGPADPGRFWEQVRDGAVTVVSFFPTPTRSQDTPMRRRQRAPFGLPSRSVSAERCGKRCPTSNSRRPTEPPNSAGWR